MENVPVFHSGLAYTRRATAAITGGQLVEVSGAHSAAPAAAASAKWLGVAGFDAAVGENVNVYIGGVQRCTAGGVIAAGDVVVAAANGRVVTNAAPAAGQQVGVAVSAASAAGNIVEVQMAR